MTPQKSFTAIPVMALALAVNAHAQEQVIRIGQTGPLTGANAFAGKDNENGVRLAIEELNAKKLQVGGRTLKFDLHSEDDQCDPKAGVAVAQKLVDAGIKYVMGPYCSGVAIPASRVYDSGGALVSTVGTNPKVTEGGYKHVFRIIASDNQIGSSMAVYGAKVLGAKTAAVVDDRTAFGQGLADEFTKEAKAQGLDIVRQEYTNDKAVDFSAILTNIKAKKPDVIFYGGYAPQAAPMARQMKQLAVKAKMLGGDTLCSPEMGKLGGDAVNETVYCAQGGSMMDQGADRANFMARYKKRFGTDADAYAASFFDQMHLIAQSMVKAGSTEPAAVAAEMRKGQFKGVAGTYAYDDKGNMRQAPITVYTFRDGKASPLASY
ncbi:MAG TPA: branched-chain amino acid ABC transporter substrate-binding protein [Burkholderiaceae bacterium]|nr:branched-chain amino acid ABC transporter substrate-binding protein [Burkholderiaceae bacterium]